MPELLQSACTADAIAAAATPLLEENSPARQTQIEGLRDIRNSLASSESAARRVAEEVAQLL